MGTKTISIMDDVYGMLVNSKLEDESFSDELRRILVKKNKRPLSDFFGILSDEEGERMLDFIEKRRSINRKLKRERVKHLK